jgi:hypothetical protein
MFCLRICQARSNGLRTGSLTCCSRQCSPSRNDAAGTTRQEACRVSRDVAEAASQSGRRFIAPCEDQRHSRRLQGRRDAVTDCATLWDFPVACPQGAGGMIHRDEVSAVAVPDRRTCNLRGDPWAHPTRRGTHSMRPCRAKKAVDEFEDPRARVRGAAHPFPRTLSMFDFKLVGTQAPEPWTR